MFYTSVLFASLLVVFACASPQAVTRNMVIHETRDKIPTGFVNHGPAPANTMLKLRIALRGTDIDGLRKKLMDVSAPASKHYGQHLTKGEVEEFTKPSSETVTLVNDWLHSNGIQATTISSPRDWLAFTTPVSQANGLLDANFSIFTHEETGQQSILTLSYSIPSTLQGHIDLIHPTTTFVTPKTEQLTVSFPVTSSSIKRDADLNITSDAISQSCAMDLPNITPACIQSFYGIPSTKANQLENSIATAGFLNDVPEMSDLSNFLLRFRPDLNPNTAFTVISIDDGAFTSNGQESMATTSDIQYTVGIASAVPSIFISVGEDTSDGLEGFIDLMDFLFNMISPPKVLSMGTIFDEEQISSLLALEMCDEIAALGSLGVSIIIPSGNGGVGGDLAGQTCTDFVPTFPSTCPFVTSVGATDGIPPQETGASFSSGGFSNVWKTPEYQITAAAQYLIGLGDQFQGLFNSSGRGYPDVSVHGQNAQIVFNGVNTTKSGTSPPCPIFASIIALINEQRLAAGFPTLGFLNLMLYSDAAATAGAFTDITGGNNPGCGTAGFSAAKGWDPITGLGTPVFEGLLNLFGAG